MIGIYDVLFMDLTIQVVVLFVKGEAMLESNNTYICKLHICCTGNDNLSIQLITNIKDARCHIQGSGLIVTRAT